MAIYIDNDYITVDNLEIPESEIHLYLFHEITLNDNVTFNRIFELILLNHENFEIIFQSATNQVDLNEFKKDLELVNIEKVNFQELNICWLVDIHSNSIYESIEFNGFNTEDNEYYALDLLSLSSYKDMIIKLNTNYTVANHQSDTDDIIALQTTKEFKLYELLYSILFEICYHGSIENRNDERNYFKDRLENLRVENNNLIEEDRLLDIINIIRQNNNPNN